MGDAVDVDAARGDVGCDQDAHAPAAERLSARSRWLWLLLPWMASAAMPALVEMRVDACRRRAWCG